MVEREHVDEELVESWAIAGRLLPGELPAWSIRLVSDLGVQGRCLPATREIVVSDTRGGLDRVVTVVHERAHALAGGGHGPAWQALMQRAIVACEDDALRDALEFEVGSYRFDRSSAVPTASDVLWSAARRAGKDLDADLGGVFAVVPRLRDLCLSLQEEALEAEREAEISSCRRTRPPSPNARCLRGLSRRPRLVAGSAALSTS